MLDLICKGSKMSKKSQDMDIPKLKFVISISF